MTPTERIDARIRDLMGQYAALTRGRAVMPPKAATIAAKIKELQQRKAQMAADERHSLGSLLPKDAESRNEIYRHLLKLPLIADFLYGACVDLQSLLQRYGMNELTLSDKVQSICRQSKELAFTLSQFEGTKAILSSNGTLTEALDKKVESYLRRQMNITH